MSLTSLTSLEGPISVVSLLKVVRFNMLGAVSTGTGSNMIEAGTATGEGAEELLRMLRRPEGHTRLATGGDPAASVCAYISRRLSRFEGQGHPIAADLYMIYGITPNIFWLIQIIAPITRLPTELLHSILSTIDNASDPPSVLMLVCRYWYNTITAIWAALKLGTRTPRDAVTRKLANGINGFWM